MIDEGQYTNHIYIARRGGGGGGVARSTRAVIALSSPLSRVSNRAYPLAAPLGIFVVRRSVFRCLARARRNRRRLRST